MGNKPAKNFNLGGGGPQLFKLISHERIMGSTAINVNRLIWESSKRLSRFHLLTSNLVSTISLAVYRFQHWRYHLLIFSNLFSHNQHNFGSASKIYDHVLASQMHKQELPKLRFTILYNIITYKRIFISPESSTIYVLKSQYFTSRILWVNFLPSLQWSQITEFLAHPSSFSFKTGISFADMLPMFDLILVQRSWVYQSYGLKMK